MIRLGRGNEALIPVLEREAREMPSHRAVLEGDDILESHLQEGGGADDAASAAGAVNDDGHVLESTATLHDAALLTPAELALVRRGPLWLDRPSVPGLDERARLLGWLVMTLLGVQFFGQALGVWRGRMAVRLGQQLSQDLRDEVFRHLQTLSLKYFDKRQPGALIARVTNDTQALEAVLVESIQIFFSNILLFVGIGIVLLWMNWKLTLLVFIPAPVVLLLSKFSWDRMMNVWRRAWHLHSHLTAAVSDSLAGVRVVRAFAKEHRNN